jgi:hypothetical protein
MLLCVLHDYLTRRGADDPNTTIGLSRVYTRIGLLLSGRAGSRRTAPIPRVAHRRPTLGLRREPKRRRQTGN